MNPKLYRPSSVMLLVLLFMAMAYRIHAQTPDPSAALQIDATDKGLLPPRLTEAQMDAISSPAEGLIIYCTDCTTKGFRYYDGTQWLELIGQVPVMLSPSEILAQIGNEADDPDVVNSSVTASEIASIPTVTGVDAANITAYQDYIDNNPALFSSPATVAEVQAMVTAVNSSAGDSGASVLVQIGTEGDNPDVVESVVSATQIASIPGITGVDSANEVAYRTYIDNNPDNFSSPATIAEVQAMVDAVNNLVPSVTSSTGQVWMDRNLGASQVATSVTDSNAYGDLYQWGRTSDGHQLRTSSIMSGPVVSGMEGANFIIDSSDWLTVSDNTRWNGSTKGAHDPCPTGFRVPTIAEWEAETAVWSPQTESGAFMSPLKLTRAGFRFNSDGSILISDGRYASSTTTGTTAYRYMRISVTTISTIGNLAKASGASVRCIQE